MVGGHVLLCIEVGDRSSDLPDAVVASGGQAQPLDRGGENPNAGAIQPAMCRQKGWCQPGVRPLPERSVPVMLKVPSGDDSGPHVERGFPARVQPEHVCWHRRHLDGEVEPVAKRT